MKPRAAERWLENVSSPEETCRHPLNKSTAKQLFTFSRADRFLPPKMSVSESQRFCNPDDLIKKHGRACSLGKGSKYDFLREARRRATPDFYSVDYHTQQKNQPKYKFGISREMSPQFSIFTHKAGEIPGPGTYNPKEPPTQAKCTFKIRLKEPQTFRNSLGPGTYEAYNFFGQQSAHLPSCYQNGPQFRIVRESVKKSAKEVRLPFFYDLKFQINKSGVYFNTKYKSSLARSFGKQERMSIPVGPDSPGPGSYLPVSDFGTYVSSAFVKEVTSLKRGIKIT